jgi:bacterioferritin (cytochrome b1)
MSTHTTTNEAVVANLNSLLRGEISAVETYNQAIRHLTNQRVDDLVANRNCHSKRVDLLRSNIIQHGGVPDETSGLWGSFARLVEKGAALISAKSVIAALEEGEDRGLAQYRKPGDMDPSSIQLIETVLLARQLETHERMRLRKLSMA